MPIDLKQTLKNKILPEPIVIKGKRQRITDDNPAPLKKILHDSTEIFEEAKKGNFNGIKSLVEQGINIDTIDQSGMTVLHRVIQKNNTELAKQIINELNPNLNIQNQIGWTPLYIACMKGNFEIAEILLNKGANPDLNDSVSKVTPLYLACENFNFPMIKLLVEYKADMNISNSSGNVLHAVAMSNYTNIGKMGVIRFLLEKGAKVTKNNHGYTAGDYLARDDKSEKTEFDKLVKIIGNVDEI